MLVEGTDKVGELACGGVGDAVGIVAGGDGCHGVGEGFDGLGDLFREEEGEPARGEESQARSS